MRLSIITVNYNNPTGLEATIQSVISQTNHDFEYIVVDGGSSSGDLDVIKKYCSFLTAWVSERDSGIYNAMNKGVQMASGEYCLFLNSGDTLYCQTTIEDIYKYNLEADFIEGIIAFKDKPGIVHKPESYLNFSYYKLVSNNYHQASLIHRNLLVNTPYDESYQIAADMKFNIEVIINQNCTYQSLPIVISTYEGGGRSMTINHLDERDRLFRELIPSRILNDYDDLLFLKIGLGRVFYPLFYKIGHSYILMRLYLQLKRLVRKDITEAEMSFLTSIKESRSCPLQYKYSNTRLPH